MANWQGFLREAHKFWTVAEVAFDATHTSQAASNAILAVIAANDAICLYHLGERPGGESHGEAARFLKDACKGTRWERDAAKRAVQFTSIIREKNAAQYEGRPIGPATADRIMKQAKRFIDWADGVLPDLPLSPEDE